ncbi:hypothetical protein GQ600_24034 [Phytophthora cactorum]|nr:hypothetical protein GQ600_24034 [Phytophthora cactorum]
MSAAQGSVSKLDVLSRFGYEQPDLLIHFANLELAGSFNTNKSVKRNKGGGNHTKMAVFSSREWMKRGSAANENTTKEKRKKPKTKLSHIPENSWYISNMNLQHSQLFGSVTVMTSEFLTEQPGFTAAIVEGYSTSMARVKADPVAEYGRLPSFLKEFSNKNSSSRICCQLDSRGRFFRAFRAIGTVVTVQDSLLPVWECDGIPT